MCTFVPVRKYFCTSKQVLLYQQALQARTLTVSSIVRFLFVGFVCEILSAVQRSWCCDILVDILDLLVTSIILAVFFHEDDLLKIQLELSSQVLPVAFLQNEQPLVPLEVKLVRTNGMLEFHVLSIVRDQLHLAGT
jgi:hypothetical protein